MSEYVFPSQAWFTEYKERINADDEYAEIGAEWGVGFNGDMLFEMTDIPVDEVDVDDLPEALREDLETFVLPGDTGYALLGLEAGECTSAEYVQSPDEVDEGFVLSATYDVWKDLVNGDIGAIDGMMSGKFDLRGDMQKVLQFSDAAARLTELSASIDATFVDEKYA